jgi:multidrug efflux system membrane fusion protein
VDPKAGKARRVKVRIGPYAADGAAVLAGLKAADWVVIAGGHLLHEGQDVLPVDRSNRPVTGEPSGARR